MRHLIRFSFQGHSCSLGREEMFHNLGFAQRVDGIGINQLVIWVCNEYLIIFSVIIA